MVQFKIQEMASDKFHFILMERDENILALRQNKNDNTQK